MEEKETKLKRKKPANERRFDQKYEKLSNQYFLNKIVKRIVQTLRIESFYPGETAFQI